MEQEFTRVIDLLYLAKQSGVEVILNDGRLQLKIPENQNIDKTLLDEIRDNKKLIIEFLSNDNWKSKRVSKNYNKINRFDRDAVEHIPLSFSQERLWFIDRLEGSVQYHASVVLRLKGDISRSALSSALGNIVDRHEVLRTVYHEENGKPFQVVKRKQEWELNIVDGVEYADEALLRRFVEKLTNTPFDLAADYMLRAHLIVLGKSEHILVVTIHHIASDGWSMPVIVKELGELYRYHNGEGGAQLPPLLLQYSDYAIWQRNYLQGAILDEKIKYWKEKLNNVLPLQLPTDYTRPVVQSSRGATTGYFINKEVYLQLQELSQREGATLFMTLLAVLKVLLYRYSSQTDICVGTSIANRSQKEVENLVGFFVNTLALRSEVSGTMSFTELLQQVRATTVAAYEHQDVPFEKVVEVVLKERDSSRTPLFQVMLVLANTPEAKKLQLGNVTLSREVYDLSTAKFDITFFVTESSQGLHLAINYSTDLYQQQTIDRMLDHYKELLNAAVEMPTQKVGTLSMLTLEEEQQLLTGFNNAQVEYPADKNVVDLFEEQVLRTPDSVALAFEGEQLTYRQLNVRANQLAHYLLGKGAKKEALIPLCIERGMDMIVGILGILKAGCAYVPVDTDFPVERISYMLEDVNCTIVVSSSLSRSKVDLREDIQIIETDGDWLTLKGQPATNPGVVTGAGQLAYVIYTSGSTGMPKGVMIEHRSLVDYVFGLKQSVQIEECASFALVSTIATDLGNTVLFTSLLTGGVLYLFSKELASDAEALYDFFTQHPVDCLKIVPSHWQALSTGSSLLLPRKLLIFGGETLQSAVAKRIFSEGTTCRIINHYGPTETTIGKLLHQVKEDATYGNSIPIGKPFSNTNVYVLNTEFSPAPIGVPGQLYIAGAGIARGYVNNPELTREKFVPNPFDPSGSAMYKTGDIVKYLPDGNILFIGRADSQVKIRGYRIELGDIESALLQNEAIREAAVLALDDKQGNKKLVGYVVARNVFDKDNLIFWLQAKLPEYMIPSSWVELESIPLTANGKIDRRALPDLAVGDILKGSYAEPRNETEQAMAAIWQDILEVEQAGIHDDFFELGGHSLLAVRLISAIRRKFQTEMSISDIFDYSTIALLSEKLEVNDISNEAVLPPVNVIITRPAKIPMSFSQERLWFIDRLEGSVQYHVPAVLRIKGRLNVPALENALKTVVTRHEALRTVFIDDHGQAYQQIKDAVGWELEVIEEKILSNDAEQLQEFVEKLTRKPYDLSKDYMLRAHLIRLDENEYILVATLHHITSDRWSRYILVKEVVELYNSYETGKKPLLPELKIQYADFSIWQRQSLQGEILEKKLGYWKKKLDNVKPLYLPSDYVRPLVQSTKGYWAGFHLDAELTEQLQAFSQKNGATIFMTLLAAFKVLLYRYSGQDDICVGTAVAGRQQQELEGLIGFFVNTLALRSEITPAITFADFLKDVKKTTIEAFENQEIPFEKVVDAVTGERSLSTDPLVQIMFGLQNTPEIPALYLGEAKLTQDANANYTTLFELFMNFVETKNGLQGSIQYSTDLYKHETIVAMVGHYKQILHSVLQHPEKQIASLQMLSTDEEFAILHRFNNTTVEYQRNKSIVELFEEQAAKTPLKIAIVFDQLHVSYQELNERSNQLSNLLIEAGVLPGQNVGLLSLRNIEMIIAMFGILKAGAAYVPLNTAYPQDRLSFILEDAGIATIVCTDNTLPATYNLNEYKLLSVQESLTKSNCPAGIKTLAKSPVYVMYTSGTTGQPKGIAVSNRNVTKLVFEPNDISVYPEDIMLQWSNYAFDGSVYEIYCSLLKGAKLVLIKDDHAADVNELAKIIKSNDVTVSFVTTALFNAFIDVDPDALKGIRKILFGGEMVSLLHVRKALQCLGKNKIVHVYGPTETTVYATYYPIQETNDSAIIPIGKPLANTKLFVFDKNKQMVPVGVPGELYIGGDGVSLGYLNSPELTASKFIPDTVTGTEDAFFYRTGDLVKWTTDGDIIFLRRLDEQVKVRGYRIELGEIESVLTQTGLISQAVVLAKEDKDGNKRLLGFFKPQLEILKVKERELYNRLVESWKELYETEYAKTEEDDAIDPEFNIIGWNDSFTGEAIPAVQMQEWLEDIMQVIFLENPQNVLEIGSGTGLIYYQLAGKIKNYYGTDFSQSSISQINQRISKGARDYGYTKLQVSAAHQTSLNNEENVDTVILNSIVQYFPGEDYLNEVIEKSITALRGNGRIIIGDVRDNRLLESFRARLQLEKLQYSLSVKEFKWTIDQDILKEEELCLSPGYFNALQEKYPEITNVEVTWKRGDYLNELTLYRYTVVIHVGIKKNVANPSWLDWRNFDKQEMVSLIDNNEPVIAIKNVPNPRLWKEKLLNDALDDKSVTTVRDIQNALTDKSGEFIKAEEIFEVAKASGYSYKIFLSNDPFRVNLYLQRTSSDVFIKQPPVEENIVVAPFANIPLFIDISSLLQKDIRSKLQERLPEYMIPSELIPVGQLPLTSNGKIDRRFLSERDSSIGVNKINYEAPVSKTEVMLAKIWQDLLAVERIGIHDNFFELGGHSLLATRVISAVHKQLNVEVTIKDLFLCPTIAALSLYLDSQSIAANHNGIKTVIRPEYIPLSFSQERLWFVHQLEGSTHYHIPAVLRLKGNLDIQALENALQNIIARHQALRTVFYQDNLQSFQRINEAENWTLSFIGKDEYEGTLSEYINRLIKKPFDLSRDYMLRANLITLSDDEHVLAVTMHHIAADGWSLSILVKEFAQLYSSFTEGRQINLPALDVQYADYAIWQRSDAQEEIIKDKLQYWKKKLGDAQPLQLPEDFTRPIVWNTSGAVIGFNLDKELSDWLHQFSQKQKVTLFMTMLSVFKLLLAKYSGQYDISVGTSIAGRQHQEVEGLIGFFVNMLVLRTQVENDHTFVDLVGSVRDTTLEAYECQDVPFEKVVDAVVQERDFSRNPLVQVMFVLLNTPEIPELKLGEVSLKSEPFENATSKFDITFLITETSSGLKGSVQYSTALYKETTILQMITRFKQLLQSAMDNPLQKTSLLKLLTPAEENSLLNSFELHVENQAEDKNIATIFEEQVANNPAKIALVFEGELLSYNDLNIRANQLAHYLHKKGVIKETLVPICLHRSLNLMVSVLAVLKAGGAYVTVDPGYPAERIKFMLEDTAAALIITNDEARHKLPASEVAEIISIDSQWNDIEKEPAGNLLIPVKPENLAYVIYTSGSTGRPKGVLVEQRNVISLVKGVDYVSLSDKDVLLSTGSPSFDASTFEYWSMLLNGGQLILCAEQRLLDNALLKREINSSNVNIMWFTSGWFNQLAENDIDIFKNLQTILVGGEALSPWHIKKVRRAHPHLKIINGYGPTENTTFSLTYPVNEIEIKGAIPVGRPLTNRGVLILDENLQLVPPGAAGYIYLGGAGLVRGYLNQEKLTAEKFVTNPYFKDSLETRLYSTGDIGRLLPDGNIDFIGRKDEQVKVRGYRIELGEIESVILQSQLVKQAVVLAKEDGQGTKRLAAYVVPQYAYDKDELLGYLQEKLPDYMVPTFLTEIENMPLTANGKIDRKALPEPEADEAKTAAYVAPRTETETVIAQILQDILEVDEVGVYDDFFELGGHSLMAIRVVSAIRKKLDVELSMESLFVNPTVAHLAEEIEKNKAGVANSSQQLKSLVPIKSKGTKIPLYIVSGGGGTVYAFKNFAEKLDPEQPVYGFQQPTEEKYLTEFPNTVQGIASRYIEDILLHNPTGPYALSGHCLGGVIAFEMSKQLQAMGKKVALLAMFDTVVRTRIKREPATFKNLFRIPIILRRSFYTIYSKIDFETFLLRKHTKHAIRYKVNSLKSLANKIYPYQPKNVAMEVFKKLEQNFVAASLNYHLTPYDGDILVFYAKDHYYFLDKDNNVGYKKYFLNDSTKNIWKKYVNSITMYEIEGEHSTIFYPENVKPFAELLQKHLDASNNS